MRTRSFPIRVELRKKKKSRNRPSNFRQRVTVIPRRKAAAAPETVSAFFFTEAKATSAKKAASMRRIAHIGNEKKDRFKESNICAPECSDRINTERNAEIVEIKGSEGFREHSGEAA